MEPYNIVMEIAGPFAMWARPDTGSTPTSYPIPTWSAVKGIFESIAFFRDGRAWINPTHAEVCKPRGSLVSGSLNFQKYVTNYRGPLQGNPDGAFQFPALVLVDVCYRLYANIIPGKDVQIRRGDNPCHYLQDLYNRRLKQGRCHKTPCLGWNEFTASYWGLPRDEFEVDREINLELVSVLKQVFSEGVTPQTKDVYYKPSYQRAEKACISEGKFIYD